MASTNPEAKHSGVDPGDQTPAPHLDTRLGIEDDGDIAGDTGFRTGRIYPSLHQPPSQMLDVQGLSLRFTSDNKVRKCRQVGDR